MVNAYQSSSSASAISDPAETPARREVPDDVASVAQMWVSAAYDDLRRAGPDRGIQVRGILDRYVIPWFGPRTTCVGDISYFMVHEWLLTLVGRRRSEPAGRQKSSVIPRQSKADRELSLREAAEVGQVSLATVRRRWRDGELSGAYRDSHGRIRVPGPATVALRRATRENPAGLSQPVVADALWVLRRVLGFARANALVPPGFDPTEGLSAPTPDAGAARARRPTSQPRPLNLPECARIAAHLHPVHQLVLWLQRVMGLRISEAFGILVDDVVDLGDTGLLLVRGQGGRTFRVRDDEGGVVAIQYKERTKTEAGSRVLVIPSAMLEPLRVAIEAFHTDPETGDVDETARLVPGLRTADESGQLSFREAFEAATAAEGLSSIDMGFRVTPHLLRKSVATDLAWQRGIEGTVRRRFLGHRASDDVFGRVYTLDHPELTPLAEVARILDEMIRDSIGSLVVPSTRRIRWGHANRIHLRAAHVEATLLAAGWSMDPDNREDPLCDAGCVASELGMAETTVRRWMRDGTLRCVVVRDGDGVDRRWARLSEVWSVRDRLADRILLPDLAQELGLRYHELYRVARLLGLEFEQHPTSRQFEVPPEAARRLRFEHDRVRALHARSLKVAAAARLLNRAVSTVGLMAKRGDLDTDPETDTSNAVFVTRASVEDRRIEGVGKLPRRSLEEAAVPLAEVVRFTGRSRTELLDLVRAGVLEQVCGRGACELTASSLRAWMTACA
jgi:integrase